MFAHRLAFEFDSIRVVNQPIQDRVGDRGVGDDLVPLVDRKLAGEERGSEPLAVVEDLQQIPILFSSHRGDAKIVDEEQRRSGQLLEQVGQTAIDLANLQLTK